MKKILIIMLIPSLFLLGSCEKFIEDFDISPNDPIEVTPSLLLSAAEVATFNTYNGQLARLASIMTQHSAGTAFQFVDIATYTILEGDNNNEWNSIYSNGLNATTTLIDTYGDTHPYYKGIAQVLQSLLLGIATDTWGDIPWSEALKGLQGAEFYNPNYDSQEFVISEIQRLLSEAVDNLSRPAEDNVKVPITDDYVFGGDVQSWIITANMLAVRYENRLSKRDPMGSAMAALNAIQAAEAAGMSGPENDCNAVFGPAGNELNQWYAFNLSRGGYMQMGATFIDLMLSIDDPRLPFYATVDTGGVYRGTELGSEDQSTSRLGSYYGSATSSTPLVSYVEMKFIEAEANFRLGNLGPAADAVNAAVIASVEQITGAPIDPDYELAQASITAGNVTLEHIMTHKYIALFTQMEGWSDWRRTNLPTLTADPRGSGEIPRRLPTPSDERTTNTNVQVVSNIYLPVWWDE